MIKENIEHILEEIKNYNSKLICVSKTRTCAEIMEAYNTGIRDFGENHVKELIEKIKELPQVEQVKAKDYDILYLTDYLDEFALKMLGSYEEKNFKNVADGNLDLESEEEKEDLNKLNEKNKDMLSFIKKSLDENVVDVKFTNKLTNHPVCLTTEGELSTQMQKVLNAMPEQGNVNAKMVLEINDKHAIAKKLKSLYKEDDKKALKNYAKILYAQARLIEGLSIENPTEISNLICKLISK